MRLATKITIALLSAGVAQAVALTPATAQTPAESAAASKFVDDLSNRVFAVMKDKSLSRSQVRARFRQMLPAAFDLDEIGNRLIRRYRSQITAEQYAAYKASLPEFAVNAYGDRLMNYADAKVQPVRTVPRGSKGDIDVYSRVTTPSKAPFDAIWTLRPVGGSYKVLNLTISGINLALTQEADFSSYIAKNGFDALVAFLKSSNAKASA